MLLQQNTTDKCYTGTLWLSLHVLRRYRAIFDVLEMPVDWPVEVNYHEAKAFCKWKGPSYRLPTEAEHHRIRGDPVSH